MSRKIYSNFDNTSETHHTSENRKILQKCIFPGGGVSLKRFSYQKNSYYFLQYKQ
jgi:hypothetical protein